MSIFDKVVFCRLKGNGPSKEQQTYSHNMSRSLSFESWLQWQLFVMKTMSACYRPQRSFEGYVFTPVCQSFCSQEGGCLLHCMLGYNNAPDQKADTPRPKSRPPRTKNQTSDPRTKSRYPPADGYCCGRYASYWNAFLFQKYNCKAMSKEEYNYWVIIIKHIVQLTLVFVVHPFHCQVSHGAALPHSGSGWKIETLFVIYESIKYHLLWCN